MCPRPRVSQRTAPLTNSAPRPNVAIFLHIQAISHPVLIYCFRRSASIPARPKQKKTLRLSRIYAFCRRDAAEFESVGLALDAVDVNYRKTYTVAACNPLTEWAVWLPPQVATPTPGPPR